MADDDFYLNHAPTDKRPTGLYALPSPVQYMSLGELVELPLETQSHLLREAKIRKARAYYAEHPEEEKAARKRWVKANPAKVKASRDKYRAEAKLDPVRVAATKASAKKYRDAAKLDPEKMAQKKLTAKAYRDKKKNATETLAGV